MAWTDNPVTSSTHIRAVHVNELRRAVDLYRAQIGLGPYSWTDVPLNSSVHVRAVHFTELQAAIQELWNYHDQGPLPAWSAGTEPSASRQIQASDMNDLRTWVDETDPPPPVVGANVDPDNVVAAGPSPSVLQAANINGVRLTSRNTDANINYINAALDAGLVVLAIVATNDPLERVPPDTRVILQIGNEPDVGWPDNQVLTPSQYADLWAIWRGTCPGYTMFMAGLVSGIPSYYGDFLSAMASNYPDVDLPAVVDIHPYAKAASEIPDFFTSYTAYNPALPATATEWHELSGQGAIVPFQQALGDPKDPNGVALNWNSWFPWCTAMSHDTPLLEGIIDDNGNATPSCEELIGYLGGSCPS